MNKQTSHVSGWMFYFTILWTTSANCQILNVDRAQVNDTTGKRIFTFIGLTASADKQKKNLVDLSVQTDLSVLLKDSLVTVFKINTDLTTNGEDIIQNTGFFHLRIRDNDSRKLYPEAFAQLQWNGVLGMQQRMLAGSNLRWRALHSDANNMYMGLGLMYEYEEWNFKGVKDLLAPELLPVITARKWRVNHYIKWSWKISTKADFTLANFIQMHVENPWKPRIASNASLNIHFMKYLGFAVHYDSTYDLSPVVPISAFYYSLRGMLTASF